MQVRRRPAFLDDLSASYAYLADTAPQVADAFLDEVELTIDLLGVFPRVGRKRDELGDRIRSFRVQRFHHVIYYRVSSEAIELLRLLHDRRDVRKVEVALDD